MGHIDLESINQKTLCLALKRAIVEKFNDDQWRELGFLIGNIEIIESHPRLLRSLYFGDDDYQSCVLSVVQQIVDADPRNLDVLVDFVGLDEWLADNYPNLYSKWFRADLARANHEERAKECQGIRELSQQVRHSALPLEIQDSFKRFRQDYPDSDKAAFIMMQFGSTPAHKKIIESIKEELEAHGIKALRADDKEYHNDLLPNVLRDRLKRLTTN